MGSLDVISSSFDVASIVSQLMKLERQPVFQLEDRVTSLQNKVTAYQNINTRLSALASSVNNLLYRSSNVPLVQLSSLDERMSRSIFTSRTATSSNDNILTASASGTTTSNGNYSINVMQLAQAKISVTAQSYALTDNLGALFGTINGVQISLDDAKAQAAATKAFAGGSDTIGADGKITIAGKGNSADITVTAGMTLEQLRDAINIASSTEGLGITAAVEPAYDEDGITHVGERLAITSNDAGTANAFSLKIDDDGDENTPNLSESLGFKNTQSATNAGIRELQTAINDAKAGVTASIIYDGTGYRLTITSKETGADNGFEMDGALGALGFETKVDAQDALLTINGILITSSSNTVKEAIEGVTINVKNVTKDNENVTLNVGVDNDTIVSAVKEIVSAYNNVSIYINSQFYYNSALESSGALAGDSTLRMIQQRLQSAVSQGGVPFGENNGIRTMGQLGISFEKDGSLTLNESELRAALDKDFDAAAGFFLGYEKEGYTNRIGGMLTNLSEALSGINRPNQTPIKGAMDGIQTAMNGLNSNISQLQKSIEEYERRLQIREDQLYAQFMAADEAMRMMRVMMSSLSSSLASLGGNSSSSSS